MTMLTAWDIKIGKAAKPVHGEFHATGSTGGEMVLYDRDKATVTLSADERLYITYARLVVTAAGAAAIHWNKDGDDDLDDGDAIIRFVAASGMLNIEADYSADPMPGPVVGSSDTDTGKPRVICASGGVDAFIMGWLVRP